MEETPGVAVAVPLGDHEDPDLVADRLFVMGATAVLEREAPGGGLELVAELPADAVADLPAGARLLGPAEDGSSWVAPTTTVRCGDRIVVSATPTDGDPDAAGSPHRDARPDDVVVQVVAGQAFGTGSHASTRLCLALCERLAPGVTTVLDVGCGTGVLGVAALLSGAGTVRAIDVDPVAVQATLAAAERNGVADRLVVDATALADLPGAFDLVLANLLAPILEDLGPDLVARVAPGGSLVVGGVLADQVDRVVTALGPLQVVERADDDDWVALALTAPTHSGTL